MNNQKACESYCIDLLVSFNSAKNYCPTYMEFIKIILETISQICTLTLRDTASCEKDFDTRSTQSKESINLSRSADLGDKLPLCLVDIQYIIALSVLRFLTSSNVLQIGQHPIPSSGSSLSRGEYKSLLLNIVSYLSYENGFNPCVSHSPNTFTII